MTAPQEITGHAQRAAWLAKAMPPVEQLGTDLWSIPVPIPQSPLRYVSVYVLANDVGVTVIDAGWDHDEGWDALVSGLGEIGASTTDVRGILVTHMHPDHLGLAGRLREASGAWIALHEADHAIVAQLRDATEMYDAQVAFLIGLGAASDEAATVAGTPEGYSRIASLALPDRHLRDGERADVPGWDLRAVHTPGHTPGHLCFADARDGRFFSGDHVLPRISPNISVYRDDGDALGDFLGSLAKVRDTAASEVFPAHEWRFTGLASRSDDLVAHHGRRLEELLAAMRAHPAGTPWELAGHLTWSRPWSSYDGFMRVSAVTETAAHVQHLLRLGRITSTGGDVPRYTVAD